jgi:hypothetical protein
MNCRVCDFSIDKISPDDLADIFWQADSFGMESLTEYEQMVIEGEICSKECLEKLEKR